MPYFPQDLRITQEFSGKHIPVDNFFNPPPNFSQIKNNTRTCRKNEKGPKEKFQKLHQICRKQLTMAAALWYNIIKKTITGGIFTMSEQKKNYTVDDLGVLAGAPADEQETTIVLSRTEDKMSIWTTDNTMVTKLRALMIKNPKDYKLVNISTRNGSPAAYEFEAPKKLLSLRSGETTRVYTDEQRAAAAERLRAIRTSQKGGTDNAD